MFNFVVLEVFTPLAGDGVVTGGPALPSLKSVRRLDERPGA
ncbi:hypothetical protein ACCUM_4284 [Candidatus Accumulibacter phosphatis]|uniref:Uncharacterized protein n=1 Tax=Candidatus Accumulibacter phosphatis TaxID=327160 RepID=A0A5S4EH49_9PROT|nr:hypothetical protein ACCUM_4284 [Candidatus Accumulibacter phosphatis]